MIYSVFEVCSNLLVLVLKVFTDIYFGKLKNSTLFRIGIAECK